MKSLLLLSMLLTNHFNHAFLLHSLGAEKVQDLNTHRSYGIHDLEGNLYEPWPETKEVGKLVKGRESPSYDVVHIIGAFRPPHIGHFKLLQDQNICR